MLLSTVDEGRLPELGLIEGQPEQILDTTPMLGAAAVRDTATLVGSGSQG